LNTTEIIPVLVKAVQELSSENEELKKENAELKSRLERLEKIVLQGGIPQKTDMGSNK
jgi:regulator of replication initiation timing